MRDLVLGAAALLIALQLGFRAWGLYGSWFYLDDFQMLDDASREGLEASFLLEPYDSQFMPIGRFLAWVVSASGDANWPVAASLTLFLQLAAGVACLWMLVTLFGTRWGVLAPLALYLFTTISLPGTMWWAASLNTVPLQVAFFCSIATWVRYLRDPHPRWLAATMTVLILALLAYVKSLVLFPLLAFVALAWFAEGGALARVRQVVRRFWPAVVLGVPLGVAYLAYYTTQVPQLTAEGSGPVGWSLAGRLADNMLIESLAVGLLGGPWRWSDVNPPAGLVDAPDWSISLAWALLALFVAYWALCRIRTGRAWALLGGYALASYLLLLVTRAPAVGAVAGLEYRYLADVSCAAALAVGLATMPLLGSTQASAPRSPALLRAEIPSRVLLGATALVCVSGMVSSWAYAGIWHRDNPGERFLKTARAALQDSVPVPFADTIVPNEVIPGYLYPFNTSKRLLPVVVDNATFPTVTPRLAVLADDGSVRSADIDVVTESLPGPKAGCGWEVTDDDVRIPMERRAFEYTYWVRIGYLGTSADVVEVTIGDQTYDAQVRKGLHDLFLNVVDEVPYVTLGGLKSGTPLCVDQIEVGPVTAGGAW
ncbi:hypothetical protein [Nocardioides sp.]|uniref:hypothetical protein n=1 Tax=Nocardioides sp. TaxID=35761 RepID=UPI00273578ED|nr:hypothetical protein [Nocardioides sp.]MDP3894305.1 hypothetical protein [Nocardioides sp.]